MILTKSNTGISTSTDIGQAASFADKNIYIIDLTEHPMAFSVAKMACIRSNLPVRVDSREVNVANSIDKTMVVGHYNLQTEIFTPNPNYLGKVVIP
ncbi:MAG: hypothetical protein ACRC5A_10405 [Enterobacteriaceae bacterium]